MGCRFQKWSKKLRKNILFLRSFYSTSCCKFSRIRREYLSLAVNVSTNSPKGSHITKRDIFQVSFPQSDEKCDKGSVMQISQVFGTFYNVAC